jgi:LssY-like putative type I secretion system component LssY
MKSFTLRKVRPVLLLSLLFFATVPVSAQLVQQDPPQSAKQSPAGKRRLSQEIQLTGDQLWVDTGISLQPGERIVVSAGGTLRYPDAKDDNGPDGITRGFKDLLRILPFNAAGRGALIGRVGDLDVAQPFLLGSQRNIIVPVAGSFAIGINQTTDETAQGTYKVHIEIYEPDPGAKLHLVRQVQSISGVNSDLFAKIPRRVADKDGNPGDMVNFVILGSEEAMQKVFTTAGWVKVDADVRGTLLHGILESISKESYLTMPMSPLYLFGRTQDYGWAHAEPIKVVASRNHLRVWKAPFSVDGQILWVGAATHDVGFERDERNNGVTHKIDPDIDLERDYLEKTLISTGLVDQVAHFLPRDALKEARTATGGSFHTTGQVLVLQLAESSSDVSAPSNSPRH